MKFLKDFLNLCTISSLRYERKFYFPFNAMNAYTVYDGERLLFQAHQIRIYVPWLLIFNILLAKKQQI